MIARLDGTVLGAAGTRVVVGVGGLGLAVSVTPQQSLLAAVGSPIALHTTLIVREDDMSLYGFGTQAELDAFDLLRGVSGVGPKSALGVLSHMTPNQLADAVAREDETAFKAVSGIGPKTARLIIVQLAGKLHATPTTGRVRGDAGADVLVALTGLGWPERQARAALDAVGAQPDAGSLLRAALAELGPRA
jgi:Holliday junction DNA helicase RuvA